MLAFCAASSVAFADGDGRAVMAPVVSMGEEVDAASVPAPPGFRWKITKLSWSASDEKAYGEFVHAIGMSDCRDADECLKSAANIYRASDPAGIGFFADCADLPYLLRAYFAWKNGLPFSYASGVAAVGNSNDLRYSRYGNYVYARTDVRPPAEGMWPNARTVFWNLNNNISSAMYRFAPGPTRGEPFDFYPVKIAPGSIRPGTIIYDPNGHVAVVYDVDDEGRIRFIDSHPDNSVTRGNYGRRFVRASAPMGAGFKNWRPLTLTGAQQGADGSYFGGVIVPKPDAQLADWSDEQFFGTVRGGGWQSGRFVYKGETIDYYDYVRRAVAGHDIVYDPVVETRSMVKGFATIFIIAPRPSTSRSRRGSTANRSLRACPRISTARLATGRPIRRRRAMHASRCRSRNCGIRWRNSLRWRARATAASLMPGPIWRAISPTPTRRKRRNVPSATPQATDRRGR
jgi:hypothetical protein